MVKEGGEKLNYFFLVSQPPGNMLPKTPWTNNLFNRPCAKKDKSLIYDNDESFCNCIPKQLAVP